MLEEPDNAIWTDGAGGGVLVIFLVSRHPDLNVVIRLPCMSFLTHPLLVVSEWKSEGEHVEDFGDKGVSPSPLIVLPADSEEPNVLNCAVILRFRSHAIGNSLVPSRSIRLSGSRAGSKVIRSTENEHVVHGHVVRTSVHIGLDLPLDRNKAVGVLGGCADIDPNRGIADVAGGGLLACFLQDSEYFHRRRRAPGRSTAWD